MIVTIRSLIFIFCISITVVLYAGLIIVVTPFTNHLVASRIATAWGRINIHLLRYICGLKHEIDGWENLPTDRSFIIMAKHQSAWETITLRGLLPFNQAWVLKEELLRLPFFGRALKNSKQIAIDRKAGKRALKQLLTQGRQALDEGRIVIVFPEGTRTAVGESRKYNIGGAMLAEKSGAHVVPIAHNAGVFWPRNSLQKHPGTIRVVVGEPLDMSGLKAGEINQAVSDWIEKTMASLPNQRDD